MLYDCNSVVSNGGSGGQTPPRLASDGLGFESRSLGSQRIRKERDFDRKNAILLRLIES